MVSRRADGAFWERGVKGWLHQFHTLKCVYWSWGVLAEYEKAFHGSRSSCMLSGKSPLMMSWLSCIVSNPVQKRKKSGVISDSAVLIFNILFRGCPWWIQQGLAHPLTTFPILQLGYWVRSREAVCKITCSFLWRHKRLFVTYAVVVSRTWNTLV